MTGAQITSPEEHARRRAIADAVIAEGLTMAEFSRRAGLCSAGGLKWLRHHEADRYAALTSGRKRRVLTPHGALCRLLIVREARAIRGRIGDTARALGMSPQALCTFVRRWARDGVDKAIAELWPGDDPPSGPDRKVRAA